MKTKIRHLSFILFVLVTQNLAATNIQAGEVYGHWTLANSPYHVMGNITVPGDSLLQIDAGVVVEFQGHFQFLVNGRIHSVGSSVNPVVFSAVNDWWGFRFDGIASSQDSSLFVYCTIRDGNASGTNNYRKGGAFFISNFSKIRVEHCTITNNTAGHEGGAFYCDHANPKIYNNVITNNTSNICYGGAIFCYYSSPSIAGNTFTNNQGSIYCDHSSPEIIGNVITHSSYCFAIGCINSSNAIIINNVISHNSVGLAITRSAPDIVGNLITYNAGNDYGGGLTCSDGSCPNIINNTIANNSANIAGGGINLYYLSSPIFRNTILWGNSAPNNQGEQLSMQQSCSPVFYSCDVQGGAAALYYTDAPGTFTGAYVNNLDSNPLFNNPASDDFSLQQASPCVDAGGTPYVPLPVTDISGNPRICNVIEMGAYEICATGIFSIPLNYISTSVFPVPASNSLVFEFSQNDFKENLELQIINIEGKIIKQIPINASKTKIPADEMISGIYFYQLKDKYRILSAGKIIIE